MAITVTFDSNVWRKVVSPNIFKKDARASLFSDLHDAVKAGRVLGYLPETIFNLEAIPKRERQKFFGNYEAKFTSTVISQDEKHVHARVCIGPDLAAHPGNSDVLQKHMDDALRLGFRLLTCPRIGLPRSPNISKEMLHVEEEGAFTARWDRCCEVLRDIESRGCGFAQIRALAKPYITGQMNWLDALLRLPESERHLLKKAVAEWADGDSIGAHIGYQIDYFCTEDEGISAGPASIFSFQNRKYLTEKYAVRFLTLEKLHEELRQISHDNST